MVGLGGLEPPTSPLSGRRPSQYLRCHHRLRGRGFKQHHFYGSRLFGKVLLQDDPREQRRHLSRIQLRVDSKPSHSVYECSSADTQSDCSAIRTAYAALACGKRLNALRAARFLFTTASTAISVSVFRNSVSGTSSALPRVRMTARSMKFSNSRIFPGHSQAVSPFITAEGTDSICFCICFANFCTK